MESTKVKTVLIASGSGTDAAAVMKAYQLGVIPEIELCYLISTKKGAGCLERAAEFKIPAVVIDRKAIGSTFDFNAELNSLLVSNQIELVFLLGCVVKVEPALGIKAYNIHPADIEKFGGKKMYGLTVHERVLLEIKDLIDRGRRCKEDRFFTYPTVHEVVDDYDLGEALLRVGVEIRSSIIRDFITGKTNLEQAASLLQKQVLPIEWRLLPLAVNLAAEKILNA